MAFFPILGNFAIAADPAAFALAGTNRVALERAWAEVPDVQREGMAFLLEHMPAADARTLQADFLLENVELAYRARNEVPWGNRVPDRLFLNDVLPYANITEARDPWRRKLHDELAPLVKSCRTAGEAALLLNREIFNRYGVRYSTRRKRADQSPRETIASGLASCTGLSILLVDACRAVGVPARLAGVSSWATMEGNHTWAEVWDIGWHHVGAAEPDSRGLDHAWFNTLAGKAVAGDPERAVFAMSYAETGTRFDVPWDEEAAVWAVDVTRRYASEENCEQAGLCGVFQRYFSASPEARRLWEFDPSQQALLLRNEREVIACIWKAYCAAATNLPLHAEFTARRIQAGPVTAGFTIKEVGERMGTGWPAVLRFSDTMPVPESDDVPGYLEIVVTPPEADTAANRARLLDRLIQALLAFARIDPARVYLVGDEAAGDLVADRFAARIVPGARGPADPVRVAFDMFRNPTPRQFAWERAEGLPDARYWIAAGRGRLEARIDLDGFTVRGDTDAGLLIRFDSRLAEYDRPTLVRVNGRDETVRFIPDLKVLAGTLLERGDPELAFTSEVAILPVAKGKK